MHKDTDMTREEVVSHLKIEEDRLKDKANFNNLGFSKANIVEQRSFNSDGFKNKGKSPQKSPFKPQGEIQKFKFMGNCHECGRQEHKAKTARPKRRTKKIWWSLKT